MLRVNYVIHQSFFDNMTISKLNPDLRDKYAKIENISDEKHSVYV